MPGVPRIQHRASGKKRARAHGFSAPGASPPLAIGRLSAERMRAFEMFDDETLAARGDGDAAALALFEEWKRLQRDAEAVIEDVAAAPLYRQSWEIERRILDTPCSARGRAIKVFLLAANRDGGARRGALMPPQAVDHCADGRLTVEAHALRALLEDAARDLPELAPLAAAWTAAPEHAPREAAGAASGEAEAEPGEGTVAELHREWSALMDREHDLLHEEAELDPGDPRECEIKARRDTVTDRAYELERRLGAIVGRGAASVDDLAVLLDIADEQDFDHPGIDVLRRAIVGAAARLAPHVEMTGRRRRLADRQRVVV
jgi:hypothetical protein